MTIDYKKITLSEGPVEIEIDGQRIPVVYKAGAQENLVILFHGALNRRERPYPFFQPFLPVNAHQLAIADATLAEHDELHAGWYIGSENSALPSKVSGMIIGLAKYLGVKKSIYVGGSSGGFAALHHSALDPGSIAVVANPQTNLLGYANPSVEAFRKRCWPSAKSLEEFAEIAPIDMCRLYSHSFVNRVIYVQSAGDYAHVQTQLAPFMSVLDDKNRCRVLFDVGFWNILGHSGSAPQRAWLPWVRAALTAPSFHADEFLNTHHALTQRRNASAPPKHVGDQNRTGPDAQDLQWAELLRDHMLKA